MIQSFRSLSESLGMFQLINFWILQHLYALVAEGLIFVILNSIFSEKSPQNSRFHYLLKENSRNLFKIQNQLLRSLQMSWTAWSWLPISLKAFDSSFRRKHTIHRKTTILQRIIATNSWDLLQLTYSFPLFPKKCAKFTNWHRKTKKWSKMTKVASPAPIWKSDFYQNTESRVWETSIAYDFISRTECEHMICVGVWALYMYSLCCVIFFASKCHFLSVYLLRRFSF